MKAIDRKRRRTIQEIATARRKNAAGLGKTTGLRILKKSNKKSTIEAIKAGSEDAQVDESHSARSLAPQKPKKNKLLSQIKRKKRSCSSCWG